MAHYSTNEAFSANVRAEVAHRGGTRADFVRELLNRSDVDMSERTAYRRLAGEQPWDANEMAAVADMLGIPLARLVLHPAAPVGAA